MTTVSRPQSQDAIRLSLWSNMFYVTVGAVNGYIKVGIRRFKSFTDPSKIYPTNEGIAMDMWSWRSLLVQIDQIMEAMENFEEGELKLPDLVTRAIVKTDENGVSHVKIVVASKQIDLVREDLAALLIQRKQLDTSIEQCYVKLTEERQILWAETKVKRESLRKKRSLEAGEFVDEEPSVKRATSEENKRQRSLASPESSQQVEEALAKYALFDSTLEEASVQLKSNSSLFCKQLNFGVSVVELSLFETLMMYMFRVYAGKMSSFKCSSCNLDPMPQTHHSCIDILENWESKFSEYLSEFFHHLQDKEDLIYEMIELIMKKKHLYMSYRKASLELLIKAVGEEGGNELTRHLITNIFSTPDQFLGDFIYCEVVNSHYADTIVNTGYWQHFDSHN